jgi:CRISPR-associated protein Cas1
MSLAASLQAPTALALAFSRARCTAATPTTPAEPAPAANDAGGSGGGATLDDVLDEARLLHAWERVRANGGVAGLDGQSVAAFGRQVLGQLQALQSEVRSGRYLARPLQQVDVPKSDGGSRALAIPAVRDRVLHTALALVLGERLEPLFDDASHAYRPGRSVLTALAQVLQRRDEGCLHVLEADIEAFFDRIHHPGLIAALQPHVADPLLLRLLQHVLTPVISQAGQQRLNTRGVPQGSPLSPLLANLVLHPFDAGMRAAGHVLVRYADDFVVLGPDADSVVAARTHAEALLRPLHLALHPRKTRLTHFHHGFRFLGVQLQDRQVLALSPGMAALLPQLERGVAPPPPAEAAVEPAPETLPLAPDELVSSTPAGSAATALLNTVHVGEAGAALRLDGERVVVQRPAPHAALRIPLAQVDQIAVTANVMLSSALLRHCARRRIQVYLADPAGGDEGASLDRGALPDLDLVQRQHRIAADPAQALARARELLDGKLHNARVVLRRFARRSDAPAQAAVARAVQEIDRAHERLPFAPSLAVLRGHEGHAARAHFDAMAALLPAHWGFDGRRRRPPPDPVNVLLSFGYAVLHANALSLVRLAGLNAHLGVLHTARAGSHALVSDLIEEFRAPAVDAVVLTLLREARLQPSHFDTDPGAEWPCRLTREGRRLYVDALEAKLNSRFVHPRLGQAVDLRRALQAQVQHWARVVRGQEPAYRPLKFR